MMAVVLSHSKTLPTHGLMVGLREGCDPSLLKVCTPAIHSVLVHVHSMQIASLTAVLLVLQATQLLLVTLRT